MQKQAFGLSEAAVLVVIALVAGGVFWSLRRSPTPIPHHRDIRCSSNLKQIGLGIAQYELDYRAYPRVDSGHALQSLSLISNGNNDYLRDDTLFVCPADGRTSPASTSNWYHFQLDTRHCSYMYDPDHRSSHGTDVILLADQDPGDDTNSHNHGVDASDNGNGQNVIFLGDWHCEWTRTTACGAELIHQPGKRNNIYRADADPKAPSSSDKDSNIRDGSR